jgi:hypothetical protein
LIFLFHPVVSQWGGSFSGYIGSLLALVPVLAWAIASWKPALATMREEAAFDSNRAFHAAWQSAIVVAMLYSASAWIRGEGVSFLFVAVWSIPAHLMVSMGVFALMQWTWGIAISFRSAGRVEFALTQGILIVFLWLVARAVLASAATFSGPLADAYSAVLAVSVAAFWSIVVAFPHVSTERPLPMWKLALALSAIGLAAALLTIRIAPLDGNFLLRKLTAGAVWLAAFSVLYRRPLVMPSMRVSLTTALAIAIVLPVAYRALEASPLQQREDAMLARQAGVNPSFRLIRDLLTPSVSEGDAEYYKFLARNTNIPRSVSVAPISVDLTDHLEQVRGPKPNIFLFVIDSLRRDYVAPYNPSVRFTPGIADFAQSAIAFENSFTRYGGTGLAEPSIWVGGMMLHKQYVLPFAPMNSLEKLLKADGYDVLLSRDSVLTTITGGGPGWSELDQSRANMNFRFCATLNELEGRLASRAPSPKNPLFVYTQPQDIHISVIQREGAHSVGSGSYEGFYAPYASRVERLDACFSEFIRFLKTRGWYETSIVILTSDHGDSLGEEGRWGHAYTIFPEVLRIPLIVHLPQALRGRVKYDPNSLAFSTDITPSLYYLLGHRPIKGQSMLGRSLFAEPPETVAPDPADASLVASSYGAAYGLLSGGGRHLYISDAGDYREYAFDLSSSPSPRPLAASETALARQQIRQKILEINQFYGFSSGR